MRIIKHLQDLLENGILRKGQEVTISGIAHRVEMTHDETLFLYNHKNSNDAIFHKLQVDKDFIAEKYYGYRLPGDSWPNDWPETKPNDYSALTRLVAGLYVYADEIVCDKKKEEVSLRVGDKVIPLDMLSDQAILDIVHSLE